MESLLKSDIFFVISSFSVVVISLAILIALIYIIKILKDVRGLFKTIQSGAEALSEDLSEVRTKLRKRGLMSGVMLSLLTAVVGYGAKVREKQAKKVAKKKKSEEE